MSHYILAIDQGTSSSRALIIDITARNYPKIICQYSERTQQFYPKNGWVEHDLEDIWQSVEKSIWNVIAKMKYENSSFCSSQIISIGLTNQRETICAFNPKTSRPYGKAIVWQCKRSLDICNKLNEDSQLKKMIHEKTGLRINPYFSGTKIKWWIDNDSTLKKLCQNQEIGFGTIDSFLMHRLTAGATFKTDPSNAARTLLFDIHKKAWDIDLISALGLPKNILLPEVSESSSTFGTTKNLDYLPDGIPICGVLGDQQAALLGQGCTGEGDTKCTYGTGAFLLSNIGSKINHFPENLLTTIFYTSNGKTSYAYEGSTFIAGAAIEFIKSQLGFINKAEESSISLETQKASAPDVYFVPALSGLGTPYWQPKATGAFFGLTRNTTKESLVSAAIEGIAFSVNDLLTEMKKYSPTQLSTLKVDGGVCKNDRLLAFQADISELKIARSNNLESTALGAGFIAAVGSSVYTSIEDIKSLSIIDKTFHPNTSPSAETERSKKLSGWKKAIEAVQVFAKN